MATSDAPSGQAHEIRRRTGRTPLVGREREMAAIEAERDEDGTEGHVRGVDVFRVRDGKVAEKLSYVKG